MYTVYVCQTRCGCCSLLIIPILKNWQSCTGVLIARAGFGVPFQRCNRQIIIINAGYFVPVGKLGIAISISVCLAVCPRACLRNHTSDFHKFLWMLPTAVARSSSGGIMICYVLPVLWMTSCLQAMATNWRRKKAYTYSDSTRAAQIWHCGLYTDWPTKWQHGREAKWYIYALF